MKAKKITITARVLLMKEEGMWVMQCLDYDLAAQGKTEQAVKDAFEKTFMSQVLIDISESRKPFENIGPAPQEYFEMFKKSEPPKDPRRFCVPEWALPGFIIDACANDMRVYSPAV